jgi:hypothetical protein
MGHPRWPGFDSKTGDPAADNRARRLNQRMYRDVHARFRVTNSRNRKRKKAITRIEGGRYIQLMSKAMNLMAARDRTKAEDND